MSNGVEFEGDSIRMAQKMQSFTPDGQSATSNSKFGQWLINKGIVKTAAAAQMFLVAIVIINIIVCVLIIKFLL